jgi:hypothetical protein
VACFHDPRYKKKLIEYFIKRIYKDRAAAELSLIMDVVKRLFEAYLSSTPCQTSKASAQSEPIVAPAHTSRENADLEEFLYEDEVNRGEVNELDVYVAEKPLRWVDPSGSITHVGCQISMGSRKEIPVALGIRFRNRWASDS